MSSYDVLCIGNAIVDIIARTDDDFIVKNGIIKSAMNLIDADRAEFLYARMGPAIEASGGSAGNTAAGVASLGGRAAYFGKVANDQLGTSSPTIFVRKVSPSTPRARFASADRSLDDLRDAGRRASMNTYLGACVELGPEDVETSKVSEAKVTYFEGYSGIRRAPRKQSAYRRKSRMSTSAKCR